MRKKSISYTIGVVAETYGLHQQTLRMYEREGLLRPSRSKGNTRLYSPEDLARLEVILSLTRDLGVNLAGVSIILDLTARIDQMQRDFEKFVGAVREHVATQSDETTLASRYALVPRRFAASGLVVRDPDE